MTPSKDLICIFNTFQFVCFADPVSVCAYNTNGPPPLPVLKGSGPLNVLYVSLLYIAERLRRRSFRCVHCKLVVRFCLYNIGFWRLEHVIDAALHSSVRLHVSHRSVLLVLLLKRLELLLLRYAFLLIFNGSAYSLVSVICPKTRYKDICKTGRVCQIISGLLFAPCRCHSSKCQCK